jgi:hypothetical protein
MDAGVHFVGGVESNISLAEGTFQSTWLCEVALLTFLTQGNFFSTVASLYGSAYLSSIALRNEL